jgi:hypothetical protein
MIGKMSDNSGVEFDSDLRSLITDWRQTTGQYGAPMGLSLQQPVLPVCNLGCKESKRLNLTITNGLMSQLSDQIINHQITWIPEHLQ